MYLINLIFQTSELSLTHPEHAQNTYIAHGWAKASNGAHFTVKLSNSRNVLNTALNMKYRIAVRALVFYPCDCMAITAQHHKARAYYVLLVQEKIKIQNLKSGLYLRHSTLTLFKSKKKKKKSQLPWGSHS